MLTRRTLLKLVLAALPAAALTVWVGNRMAHLPPPGLS
jgi:hypothetical protein